MSTRRPRSHRIGTPLAILLGTIVYAWGASGTRVQFDEGLVGPTFLPLALAAIVAIASLFVIVREWRAEDTEGNGPTDDSTAAAAEPPTRPLGDARATGGAETGAAGIEAAMEREATLPAAESEWRPALLVAAIALYIASFKFLGYPLATFLLAYATLALFAHAPGRHALRALIALVVTAVFYALFALAFGVRLPLLIGAAA